MRRLILAGGAGMTTGIVTGHGDPAAAIIASLFVLVISAGILWILEG